MYFQNRDVLRQQLEELGFSSGVLAEALIKHERPAIRIRPASLDGNDAPLGASRFLGEPDLPESLEWPVDAKGVPLNFLVQINLAELQGVQDDSPLPADGHLYFFVRYDEPPWGFDPKDGPGFRVLHVPTGANLSRRNLPEGAGFEEDDGTEDLRSLLRFEDVRMYPDPYYLFETTPGVDEEKGRAIKQELLDISRSWQEGQGEDAPKHHMLGYAMVIQNPMEFEVQIVTNGIYFGGELSAADQTRAEELAPGAEDWIPLLQLDSDEFFMWGDMGAIYFWIRKQDLAARDFSKTWMILQCG